MAGCAKPGAGRPSLYSEELTTQICALIAEGQSLRRICESDQMPARRTVLNWLEEYPDFCAKYVKARDAQADYLFEEMVDIEERTLSGEVDPKAANVVLGSKRWRAEKLKPKVYGNKIAIGGADDLPALQTNSTVSMEPSEAYKKLLGG